MTDFSSVAGAVVGVGKIQPSGIQLLGTAFALDRPGVLATAAHVVGMEGTDLVLAFKPITSVNDYQDTSSKQVQTARVTILAFDAFRDLAILKLEARPLSVVRISGTDSTPVGTPLSSFGYPHADHGRLILTRQDSSVGARILIESGGVKSKHIVLNIQARPGQSGSPIFNRQSGELVAVLIGSYAPRGGGGISLGGIDPHTLHQTTYAVSAEYLNGMY